MHSSSAALAAVPCVRNCCSDIGNGSCGMGASAFLIPAIVGKRSVVTVSTTPKREPFSRRGHFGIRVHLEQRWTLAAGARSDQRFFPMIRPSPFDFLRGLPEKQIRLMVVPSTATTVVRYSLDSSPCGSNRGTKHGRP